MNRSGASGCSCAAGVDAIRVCGRPNLRRDAAAANISANGLRARMLRSSRASARDKGRSAPGAAARSVRATRRVPPAPHPSSRLGPRGENYAKYVHPEQLGDQGLALGQRKRNEPGVGDEFQGKANKSPISRR